MKLASLVLGPRQLIRGVFGEIPSMQTFYIITSLAITLLLGGALVVVVWRPKTKGDSLLIAFLSSLALNGIYALLAPIVTGWTGSDRFLELSNFISRLVCVLGYAALFLFSIRRNGRTWTQ